MVDMHCLCLPNINKVMFPLILEQYLQGHNMLVTRYFPHVVLGTNSIHILLLVVHVSPYRSQVVNPVILWDFKDKV